ncbi:MAG: DUF2335 domain-containing protein [Methylocella sp.]
MGWSGPLPPPGSLREFEMIVPGSAARIVRQFEDEAAHRRALEKTELRFRIWEAHIGQCLAGIFAVGAFGVTIYALHIGQPTVAGIFGTTTIVSGIAAFLNRAKRSE